jgi:excisionase family DNA binding protein
LSTPSLLNPEMIGPSEAGRRLGVSVHRIRQLTNRGLLPFTRTALGRLISPEDVEALRRQRKARLEAAGRARAVSGDRHAG